jgi:CheY-like chemotaxis protein
MQLRGVAGADRERTVIERQVKHLMMLVDDLLDVSRIARGKVQLEMEDLDFADVVARAIEMVSPAIDDRAHSLTVDVPRGLMVRGDAARLAQVLANLLTNAAKYTDPHGALRLSARAAGQLLSVKMADNGRGIDPEVLPRVFDLFSQERQEMDRSQGGLGLGLAIVKNLVESHGGYVQAYSEGKGRGAEFTVFLPLAEQRAHEPLPRVLPAPRAARRGAGLNVLVVDDNADAAELLGDSLRAMGHVTRVAFDGPGALALASQFNPDVVLLDLGLPVMDGFEVARHLKSLPRAEVMAIIAVTGYGQANDRQRTCDAGFDDHLIKPIDIEKLDAWLCRRLEARLPAVHGT